MFKQNYNYNYLFIFLIFIYYLIFFFNSMYSIYYLYTNFILLTLSFYIFIFHYLILIKNINKISLYCICSLLFYNCIIYKNEIIITIQKFLFQDLIPGWLFIHLFCVFIIFYNIILKLINIQSFYFLKYFYYKLMCLILFCGFYTGGIWSLIFSLWGNFWVNDLIEWIFIFYIHLIVILIHFKLKEYNFFIFIKYFFIIIILLIIGWTSELNSLHFNSINILRFQILNNLSIQFFYINFLLLINKKYYFISLLNFISWTNSFIFLNWLLFIYVIKIYFLMLISLFLQITNYWLKFNLFNYITINIFIIHFFLFLLCWYFFIYL